MYSTCLFCNGSLGRNEVIEAFPVGRRLAFDPEKGRLWVVCRRCQRWNLSPLEERWEAFEECERRYRATRLRASTDNIGLARLSEGLELVRIGRPLRPEFAAWRYSDQFGRRRKRALLISGASVAVLAGLQVSAATSGIGLGAMYGLWRIAENVPVRGRLRINDDRVVNLRAKHAKTARLHRDPEDGGWVVSFELVRKTLRFRGSDAVPVMRKLLPAVNWTAGYKPEVQHAVAILEAAASPDAYLRELTRGLPASEKSVGAELHKMLGARRLALEMALNEEEERVALEGELRRLEEDWRQAEEIAAIADNLFIPREHDDFIARHRAIKGDQVRAEGG